MQYRMELPDDLMKVVNAARRAMGDISRAIKGHDEATLRLLALEVGEIGKESLVSEINWHVHQLEIFGTEWWTEDIEVLMAKRAESMKMEKNRE
jgi:hypothetical protein